jgi:crotonyl-CoA carboxylase/reductase
MRSKRLQGSHGANAREFREVVRLVDRGLVQPCLSACEGFDDIGQLHQLMHDNAHPPGNMAALVNARQRGTATLEPAAR